jgi:hypothetical protein
MKNKAHLTEEGWHKILYLKSALNLGFLKHSKLLSLM